MGLVSQLVMRSFDVADKGELNKREGPLGRRGERTPDHCHCSRSRGEEKGKRGEECGWGQEAAKQDIKGFLSPFHTGHKAH